MLEDQVKDLVGQFVQHFIQNDYDAIMFANGKRNSGSRRPAEGVAVTTADCEQRDPDLSDDAVLVEMRIIFNASHERYMT